MRKLIRTLISFDNLMITLLTCGAIWLFTVVPQNFDFLNPIGQALGDMDLTDMVFSKFRDESTIAADTNIVIVNIGTLDRSQIAEQLNRINAQAPLVVGIDAFFRKEKDAELDDPLVAAMAATNNLVLVNKVSFKDVSRKGVSDQTDDAFAGHDQQEFDTIETSHPKFMEHATSGFSNLIIDQKSSFMTCREISVLERCNGNFVPSFALRIMDLVSPQTAAHVRQRTAEHDGEPETINFRGNLDKFYHFDADQILDSTTDLGILRGKIVLLGMLGPDLGTKSFEDNFFTPLNEEYVGRSHPDMYGVVIHANVLSMMMHGNYIDRMSTRASYILAILVLLANVMIFTFIYKVAENWYDALALGLQLGQSLLMLYITIAIFASQSYKLALTPALVCVALVGTVHDLYQDSLKKIILSAVKKIKRKPASKLEPK